MRPNVFFIFWHGSFKHAYVIILEKILIVLELWQLQYQQVLS